MQTAAVFLLSESYLKPFEVFYFSLRETESLEGIPIFVLTTDKSLRGNRLLSRIGAEIIPIQRGDGRYWFLKLNVFRDFGVDRVIYLDADLACLANIDGLLEYKGADFFGCRTLGPKKVRRDGARLPIEETTRAANSFFNDHHGRERPHNAKGLNSGVMILGRNILNEDVRRELQEIAAAGGYTGDQNVVAKWLERNPQVSFQYLPPHYNVPRRAFDCTSIEYFNRVRDSVKVLHFNGAHPWERGSRRNFVDYIWWDAHHRSRNMIESLYR